ncbi:MAG: IS5 family transposase, partial [Hydrogenophaga sp.]|nr:IS5 family transposase [Hydrogenophaga sp.]
MLKKVVEKTQISMFFSLKDTINQNHPLYILANRINWLQFEDAFSPLYCPNNGRPALPIRLMVGLLILKHIRNISDESVVEQWSENLYYQYLCGGSEFIADSPCEASELVHFRNRIGEAGIELILKESIRINGSDSFDPNVSIDTTVQEKNITYPTDNKLHRKIITKCKAISEKEALPIRQTYTRTLKKLGLDQRFRNHPKNKGKARKADRKVKTIAGRLVRELERNLLPNSPYQCDLELFKRVLSQKKEDKNKVYSLHEPEVQCISKGKEHKKYEFGNKVSIILTQTTGVIVGALSFRNPYDGHTLKPALEQAEKMLGRNSIKTATADRGYRGAIRINDVEIQTPKPFNNKTQTKYKQNKLKKQFQKRAAIEPIIGHLKSDHRLSRNFYKGEIGDAINVMLSAAAFNFKRMMRKWQSSFLHFFYRFFIT